MYKVFTNLLESGQLLLQNFLELRFADTVPEIEKPVSTNAPIVQVQGFSSDGQGKCL